MTLQNNGSSLRWLARSIEQFPSNYFALVMATGICSIAVHLLAMPRIALTLFYLNLLFFFVLGLMLVARVILHGRKVIADLCDHQSGPGFFTIVTAFDVIGVQSILMASTEAAKALWFIGISLWFVVMYTFFVATIVRRDKPSLDRGINGAWLIAAVATQSVSVLGTLLASAFPDHRELVLFFSLYMFLLGAMLYLSIITLIFYRFTFLSLSMEQLTPPYWINMGAVAITSLAGSTLLLNADTWALLALLRPFLVGFTLFFWAGGTWWIPMLIILGIWRHGVRRYPLRYDPQYWGLVFPLGMFTVCTIRLSQATETEFLMAIPQVFVWLALVAWGLTLVGMVRGVTVSWQSRATT